MTPILVDDLLLIGPNSFVMPFGVGDGPRPQEGRRAVVGRGDHPVNAEWPRVRRTDSLGLGARGETAHPPPGPYHDSECSNSYIAPFAHKRITDAVC